MKDLEQKFYDSFHSSIGGTTTSEIFEWFKPYLKKTQQYKKAIKIIKDNFPEDVLSDQLNEDVLVWEKLTKDIKGCA